jgi:hypothetical protein
MAGGALPSNVLATADLNRVSGRLENIDQKQCCLPLFFRLGVADRGAGYIQGVS